MKQKLKQYLEDSFQSVDQLKDLADDLRTVSFAIDGAIIPDSQKDINLQFARQMTANVLSSAICKNDQTPESIGTPYNREKVLEYAKPKSKQDVIHDLKILHNNLKDHCQTKLLTNAIEYLEIEELKEIWKPRVGTIETLELPSVSLAQNTISKCKFILEMFGELEEHLKRNFEDEGIYIDGIAELCNEFREKIKTVLKKEESKTGPKRFPSGAFGIIGQVVNAMAQYQELKGTSVSQCGEEVIHGLAHPAEFYFTKAEFEKFQNGRIESMRKIKKIIEEKKLSKIEIDLSQPIKELKRFNKQLNKSIELQAGIPPELAGTGMNYRTYEDAEKQRERDRKTAQENEAFDLAIAKDLEVDAKDLEEIRIESKRINQELSDTGPVVNAVKQLAIMQNKTAEILQKQLGHGNI